MKKIGKNRRITIIISIICIIVIIGIIIGANVIKVNIANGKYNSSNSGSNNKNLIPEYIKEGITLGGITGTLKVLDTSDATAKPEDITKGKTAYVNGVKITGTKITREILKIGDYVEYTPDTASAYSLTSAVSGYTSNQSIPQETMKWQIMSINEDGTVDLVSSTSTKKEIHLMGAIGYNNGIYLLNDICKKQYSNAKLNTVARSINLEDIEKKMNQYGIEAKNSYMNPLTNLKYGEKKTYTNKKYYPNLYARENGSGINTTETKKDGISRSDSYYDALTNETYSQAGNNGLTVTDTLYSFQESNMNNYFDDKNFFDLILGKKKKNQYWVASRYVVTYADYARFGFRVLGNNYFWAYDLYNSDNSTNKLLRLLFETSCNIRCKNKYCRWRRKLG